MPADLGAKTSKNSKNVCLKNEKQSRKCRKVAMFWLQSLLPGQFIFSYFFHCSPWWNIMQLTATHVTLYIMLDVNSPYILSRHRNIRIDDNNSMITLSATPITARIHTTEIRNSTHVLFISKMSPSCMCVHESFASILVLRIQKRLYTFV